MSRQPVLFVGHGAPLLAIDAARGQPLRVLGRALSAPRACLVVSAHWTAARPTLGTVRTIPLMYDFRGFPPALSKVTYPAPPAPEVAALVRSLLGGDVDEAPDRAWDHGVWTPLVHLLPHADVPLLQLSLPLTSEGAFALGRRLAPLRDQGVLLVASGNVTHDLGSIRPEGSAPEPVYAGFDAWTESVLRARDLDALRHAEAVAPGFRANHPSTEHWRPLLFAAGASDADDVVDFPVTGFEFGNLSRRSVRFAAA